MTVIGVVNDYVYGNAYDGKAAPVIIFCKLPEYQNFLYVRMKAQSNVENMLAKIEEVMKKVHGKTNLAKKLMMGKLSDDDKTTLIEYYEALPKNKPPKGSADDWKKRTDNLVTTAKAAISGGPAEKASFRKAVDCKSCHDAHKMED